MGLDYSISIPKDINNKEDKDDEDRGMGRTQGMVVMNVVIDTWTHHLTRAPSCLHMILRPRVMITRGILWGCTARLEMNHLFTQRILVNAVLLAGISATCIRTVRIEMVSSAIKRPRNMLLNICLLYTSPSPRDS